MLNEESDRQQLSKEIDYQQMSKLTVSVKEEYKLKSNRFQPISVREDRSDMSVDAIKSDCLGRYFMTHKGCPLMKGSCDLVVFQEMFWDLRPATIIQLGTYTGGSAIWMAETLNMLGIKTHVYSMDIDLSLLPVHAKSIKPNNVTFLQGDNNVIEKTFTDKLLNSLPHPWIIIEDAHVNVYSVMEHFHCYMQTGDYFVIEDLNPDRPMECYGRVLPDRPYIRAGPADLKVVKKFLANYNEYYCVDSFYTDFYGYNGSWHWNGYIRKMK